ncbi:hypothetical protein MOV08_34415 [Streptomyces yunnanensis]|uniref:Uncharacterized protein n=1 Tax=Streptomyces yunnanensis TaxID=156453 RepID=A0ABY8AJT7_9ACTN|nr:hypothetical protein [Streptomyces yunnanensis]WEB43871.1 hypothetical protein MOV08_34415 [Streptomyces yunnanensis]
MADVRQPLCDPPVFGDDGPPDFDAVATPDDTRPAYRRTRTAWTKELLWP